MAQEVAAPLPLEEEWMPPRISAGRRIAMLARRQPLGVFGLFCIGVFLFCGIFASWITPYDPLALGASTDSRATLASGVSASDTTIQISNVKFEVPTIIQVNDEKMALKVIHVGFVGSLDTKVDVQRGVQGTTVDSHAPNTPWKDPTDPGALGGHVAFPVGAKDTSIGLSSLGIPVHLLIDSESVALDAIKVEPQKPGQYEVDVKRAEEGTAAAAHEAGAALTKETVTKLESPSL